MKHETTGVVIKEFIRLKPQICLFLVDDSSEYMKGQKKNDGTTLSHKEFQIFFVSWTVNVVLRQQQQVIYN